MTTLIARVVCPDRRRSHRRRIISRDVFGKPVTSTRSYDARNRLTAITHPVGTASESYSYFADGALKTAATTDGGTWTYAYNKRRLPTAETLALGGRTFGINYYYTSLGHVSHLGYPSGISVAFNPNALGQPKGVGGYASDAYYHPDGSLASFTYGNGLSHIRNVNARGLTNRIRDFSGASRRLDYAYTYDKNGNPVTITDNTSPPYWNESRSLSYDGRDRMTQAGAPYIYGAELYTYDPLDNVRRMAVYPVGAGNYVQDYNYVYGAVNNRLSRINEANGFPEWQFAHNGFGETTSRSSAWLATSWSYQWNAAGRLIQAQRNAPANRMAYPLMPILELTTRFSDWISPEGLRDATPAANQSTWETYAYDAHGHRTRTRRSDGSSRIQIYSRAGQLLYTEDSGIGPNDPNALSRQRSDYFYLGNKLIAQHGRPLTSNAATTSYHHTDLVHSASVETNASGIQTQRATRMPYGAPYDGLYREGPGYAGHVTDTQTNLTYMQQRYYDPVALRFLSPDPVDVSAANGGNFNRYWYANNNPYRYTDPDGRVADDEKVPPPPPPPPTPLPPITVVGTAPAIPMGTLPQIEVTAPRPRGGTMLFPIWMVRSLSIPAGVLWPSPLGSHPCEMPGGPPCGMMMSGSFPPGFWAGDAGAAEWGKRNLISPIPQLAKFVARRRAGSGQGLQAIIA